MKSFFETSRRMLKGEWWSLIVGVVLGVTFVLVLRYRYGISKWYITGTAGAFSYWLIVGIRELWRSLKKGKIL